MCPRASAALSPCSLGHPPLYLPNCCHQCHPLSSGELIYRKVSAVMPKYTPPEPPAGRGCARHSSRLNAPAGLSVAARPSEGHASKRGGCLRLLCWLAILRRPWQRHQGVNTANESAVVPPGVCRPFTLLLGAPSLVFNCCHQCHPLASGELIYRKFSAVMPKYPPLTPCW